MIVNNKLGIKFLYLLVFLGLVIDSPFSRPFGDYQAFTEYIGSYLFENISTQYRIPLPFSLFEWAFLLLCLNNFKRAVFIPGDIFYVNIFYFGFIAIAAFVSVIFLNGNASATFWALKGHIIVPLVGFAVFTTLNKKEHYYSLGKIIILGIVLKAGQALFIYYFQIGSENFTSEYLIDHAYSYALSIAILTVPVILWIKLKVFTPIKSWLYIVTIFLVVVPAFILNDRRVEMVGLSLSFLLISALLVYRFPLKSFWVLLFGTGTIFVYYFLFQNSAGLLAKPIEMLDSLSNSKDTSNIYRIIENYNILKTVLENPFLGQGFGNPLHEYVKLVDISSAYKYYLINPHNAIFTMWMTSGITGMVLFMVWVAVHSMHACKVCLVIKNKFLLLVTLISLVNILRFVLFSYGDQLILHTSANMLLGISIGIISYTSSLIYQDKNLV